MNRHHRMKKDWLRQRPKSNLATNHAKRHSLLRITVRQMLTMENHIRGCHTMIPDQVVSNHTMTNGLMKNILWLHTAPIRILILAAHPAILKTPINNAARQKTTKRLSRAHALCAPGSIQVSNCYLYKQ